MNLTDYLARHPQAVTKLVQVGLQATGHCLPKFGADGFWGSESEAALKEYIGVTTDWPEETVAALNAYYGEPDWDNEVAPNQTYIKPPYPMVLAWDTDTPLTRIKCHERVAESLQRALEGILERLGPDGIARYSLNEYGGTTNVRMKRGGSEPSTHSWGIAIDLAPRQNGLRTPWPSRATMPTEAIEAFEAEGWVSLGRRIGRDAMHFQATK